MIYKVGTTLELAGKLDQHVSSHLITLHVMQELFNKAWHHPGLPAFLKPRYVSVGLLATSKTLSRRQELLIIKQATGNIERQLLTIGSHRK